MRRAIAFLIALFSSCTLPANAQSALNIDSPQKLFCPDATRHVWGDMLFGKICWSQFYPILLAGVDVFHRDQHPEDASRQALGVCGGDLSRGQLPRIGFTLGHWRPVRIIEVVRMDMSICSPTLGGLTIPGPGVMNGGSHGDESTSFYHINLFDFDILGMIGLLRNSGCSLGTFDLTLVDNSIYWPQWKDHKLAEAMNPEVSLLASIGLHVMEPIDSIYTTTHDESLDKFWMTAGSWGSMAHYTGHAGDGHNTPLRWVGAASRYMAMLARMGRLKRTVGSDTLCERPVMPIIKKSQYRLQTLFPVGQAKGGSVTTSSVDTTVAGQQVPEIDLATASERCTSPIGEITIKSLDWRSRPATGEDAVFLLWQWFDCLVGVSPADALP